MVRDDRLWPSYVALLQSAQAIRDTERAVMDGRLAVIATANRISASTELLQGRRDGTGRHFELADYDEAVAFLSGRREPTPQLDIEENTEDAAA